MIGIIAEPKARTVHVGPVLSHGPGSRTRSVLATPGGSVVVRGAIMIVRLESTETERSSLMIMVETPRGQDVRNSRSKCIARVTDRVRISAREPGRITFLGS